MERRKRFSESKRLPKVGRVSCKLHLLRSKELDPKLASSSRIQGDNYV